MKRLITLLIVAAIWAGFIAFIGFSLHMGTYIGQELFPVVQEIEVKHSYEEEGE